MTPPAIAIAPRHFAGAPNFRDIGGAITGDGRHMRYGQVFRSEGLGFLTDVDLERLQPLGIRLVCDLRSERERLRHPSRWPTESPAEWMRLNILVDLRSGNVALQDMLTADGSSAGARRLMIETYRMLPAAIAPGMGQLFARIASGDGPALVHCTAGKDRTGVICACLLRALGVDRRQIDADYLLSGDCIDRVALTEKSRETLHELIGERASPEAIDALIGVDPAYLDAAFDAIDASYGSFDGYLEQAAGVTPAVIHRLRERLLD